MTSTSISTFPDKCLFRIFDKIPLLDLIYTVELVCKRWHVLQPAALNRRHRLALIQGQPDLKLLCCPKYSSELIEFVKREDGSFWIPHERVDQIALDALMLPTNLEPENVEWVVRTLSGVTHLSIVKRGPIRVLEQVIYLLNNWGLNLVYLNLHYTHHMDNNFVDDRNDVIDAANGMIDTINSLRSLEHLKLNLSFPDLGIEPKFPILSQLKSASIHTRGICQRVDVDLFLPSLRHYARHNRGLTELDIDSLTLGKLLRFDHAFAKKFTGLQVADCLNGEDRDAKGNLVYLEGMKILCTRYTSLTVLHLTIETLSLKVLAECLVELAELFHLKLDVYHSPKETDKPESTESSKEEPKLNPINPIPSVRLLSLFIFSRSHHDLRGLNLPEILPNVQALSLMNFPCKCVDCDYQLDSMDAEELDRELAKRIEQCLRLAREPLRKWSSLRTVQLNEHFGPPLVQRIVPIEEL